MNLKTFKNITDGFDATSPMPVLFVGHGNPMNAISDNSFTRGWADSVKGLPLPRAVLCVSAHWETRGTYVTAMPRPRTIHDFYGFPKALFDVQYASPGAPELARDLQKRVTKTAVQLDHDWGLDHGTWSVLVKMYPDAQIPVFQLSLDRGQPPEYHYDLAKQLAGLRRKGVLIMGSGNIVHNLRLADLSSDADAYDWAIEFDETSKRLIAEGNHRQLIAYRELGQPAMLSVPTPEHYLPLLYILALQEKDEVPAFFNEEMVFRSGSMRSFRLG